MFLFCAGFLAVPVALPAQDLYWSSDARNAYQLISDFRLEEALSQIRLQNALHPENAIWVYLEDYASFLDVFVQEDLRNTPMFLRNSGIRLQRLEGVSEANPKSLMMQAQVLLHQSALHLQNGEFVAAGTDINKAFKLLRKNDKLHPGDPANQRLYSTLKAVFGAIPDQYRWLVSLFTSLNGSIETGLNDLHHVLATTCPDDNIYFSETVLLTALIEGRLNNRPRRGLEILAEYLGPKPRNRAMQYVMAHLLMVSRQNEKVIEVLSMNVGVPGSTTIPIMDFMLGQAKLYRGDPDAEDYIKQFLTTHKGKHFIKEAYQKLAWSALLKGDGAGYIYNMQQVLIRGSSTTDEDQQALHEAEYHATPHPVLLQSRLYYDGGYFVKASELLTDSLYDGLFQHVHRLEFLYRKGRILQAQRRLAEALHYYHLTIASGQFEPYYFACSAALQSGIIHESMHNKPDAARYFNMCLAMAPENYKVSLHQKARMGLNRIGL